MFWLVIQLWVDHLGDAKYFCLKNKYAFVYRTAYINQPS